MWPVRMPQAGSPHRARGLLICLVLVFLSCLACTGGNDRDSDEGPADETSANENSAQQVLELGAGATLTAPPAAFDGDVTIDVTSVGEVPRTPRQLTGLTDPIDITAGGQQPRKPLILRVPYDPASVPAGIDPSQAMGLLTYDESTDTWEPVPVTFDADAALMTAELNHLSWKWPWQWDWSGIGATINQFAGEQVGKRAPPAQCNRGTQIPSWVQMVAADNDNAVALRSCAESEDGALVLEVVNNRSYGVIMELDAPVEWTWVADPTDPAELVAALVLDATLPTDRLYIPPLQRASIALKKGAWRRAELSTDATGATFIATYLSLALGDLVTKKTVELFVDPLAAGCLAGFIKTNVDAVIGSLGELHTVVASTVDCVSGIMLSRALDRALTPEQQGRAAATYKALGRVSIYLKLYSTEWTTLDLWIDKALVAGPSIIPILTRPPADPNGSVPADLRGTWCLPNTSECVNVSQLMAEYPESFFDGVSQGQSGSTLYTFCTANDLGDLLGEPACTTAASMYFSYYPKGVDWDCVAALGSNSAYDGCDPDFTDAHDVSLPRLVIEMNHQQGESYADSPPLYRQ